MKALLVDDHALFREGLGLLMGQRFPEVELLAVPDIAQALAALAADPAIDLILLDLALPDSQGLDSLERLHSAPGVVAPIVVISADARPETILAAINQGATGYIPKTTRIATIERALRMVLEGGVYLPPVLRRSMAPAASSWAGTAGARDALIYSLGLSPRQVDVLRLLVQGHSTKVISRELEVAESTVKTHLIGLFRKLDVSSRTQAILAAARLGLTFEE